MSRGAQKKGLDYLEADPHLATDILVYFLFLGRRLCLVMLKKYGLFPKLRIRECFTTQITVGRSAIQAASCHKTIQSHADTELLEAVD